MGKAVIQKVFFSGFVVTIHIKVYIINLKTETVRAIELVNPQIFGETRI